MRSAFAVIFASALLLCITIPALGQRKDTKPGKRTMLFVALNDIVWHSTTNAEESQANYDRKQQSLSAQYPEIGLSHYKIYPGDRTYCYAVSDSFKELIVVWKGTDFKNADDLFNDGQLMIGIEPKRVNFAVQQTKALMAKYPGYHTTITGYSLGGTIAEEAAAKIGNSIHGVAFNTGSSPLRPSRPAANVKSYHITGDLISSFTGSGNTRRIKLPKTVENAHLIHNFFNHFKMGTLPDRRRLI